MARSLVLGGGGVTGIAWELGVLLGLRDQGVDLLDVDLTVGTSAGAAVGAQITSGCDLEDLYQRQLDPEHGEIPAELDLELMMRIFGELGGPQPPTEAVLARVGKLALSAVTVDEATRRAVIEHRLPVHTWPDGRLLLTAVDAASGAFTVFGASAGVELVDAVAASCAVPGVWPPVTIGDRRYIDGGVRSPTNAGLAAGCETVVLLAPLAGMGAAVIDREVDDLRNAGAAVTVLVPDEVSLTAMGANPLDPDARPGTAEAGRRQGRLAAGQLEVR